MLQPRIQALEVALLLPPLLRLVSLLTWRCSHTHAAMIRASSRLKGPCAMHTPYIKTPCFCEQDNKPCVAHQWKWTQLGISKHPNQIDMCNASVTPT